MTEQTPIHSEARIKRRRGPSIVWLLPVIALFVSAWMIYKSIIDQGPEITITFSTAEGLEVEKTRFKFRDVEIGRVKDIVINNDLKTIRIIAQMHKGTDAFFKDTTRFWVVRPQVGLGGVSGLNTLITGAYIEVEPGTGDSREHYTGLEKPPALTSEVEGTRYVLKSDNVRYIGAGAPLHFHGEEVGKVLERSLSEDGRNVSLAIFIRKPFDRFVRTGTQFWIDSGISIEAGAGGINVRTGPFVSLLSGGISFKVPDDLSKTEPSNPGAVFRLYDSLSHTTELSYTRTLIYTLHFEGSIRGLKVGAPVELRGIPVGKVTDIDIAINEKTNDVRIPVKVVLEPERLGQSRDNDEATDRAFIDHLIQDGLRAQLQTGSLITGQLFVSLDFYPDDQSVMQADDAGKMELPTIPPTLDQFADSAKALMDKLTDMPLDQISDELVAALANVKDASAAAKLTLSSAQETMTTATSALGTVDKRLSSTLRSANKALTTVDSAFTQFQQTMDSADTTMQHASGAFSTIEKGSTLHYELQRALIELSDAARAMRELANYLQRNPDALIRGKAEKTQ